MRVSIEILSFNSPVFKHRLSSVQPSQSDNPEEAPVKYLSLTDDEDDPLILTLLLNVLHLRNNALPTRVEPPQLLHFVEAAAKFSCVPAAARAATPWFDYIYSSSADPPLYQMVQAAYCLGDAAYFARFSERWVLQTPLAQQVIAPVMPANPEQRSLLQALLKRQADGIQAYRGEMESLVGPLSDCLANEYAHFVDCFPGTQPQPMAMGGAPDTEWCTVDKDAAVEYFSALRDANIWPMKQWPDLNLLAIKATFMSFRIPELDASDNCHFCAHVENDFAEAVHEMKDDIMRRIWGLCLDCYKYGGVNPGECRFQHDKSVVQTVRWTVQDNASGK